MITLFSAYTVPKTNLNLCIKTTCLSELEWIRFAETDTVASDPAAGQSRFLCRDSVRAHMHFYTKFFFCKMYIWEVYSLSFMQRDSVYFWDSVRAFMHFYTKFLLL